MKLAKNLARLGTESAFSILAEAKKLEAQGKEMIHLGLGQPDFKTPQHIVDAAKKALDDGHHGYVLPNGILECRQAVTCKIKYMGVRPEEKIHEEMITASDSYTTFDIGKYYLILPSGNEKIFNFYKKKRKIKKVEKEFIYN